MKLKLTLFAILLPFFFIETAQAAGSPLHENFSELTVLTQNAIDTGKTGNSEAFVADTVAVLKAAKEQSTQASSPAMQRITSKLRLAMNEAKAGKIAEGTAALEDALANMKETYTAPKFGGGS